MYNLAYVLKQWEESEVTRGEEQTAGDVCSRFSFNMVQHQVD